MLPGARGFNLRLDPWGYVALIFGLALFSYWPALNGALLWDDPAHVTRPDQQSWEGFLRIWTNPLAAQQYYPFLHSVFWLQHRLWGDATLGYHLVIVLEHAAAACLLALGLRRLWDLPSISGTGNSTIPRGTEWVAALLFTVHPAFVESVAWISEQKNTLSLLLYLAAAFVYLDFSASRRRRSYGLATFLFVLALASKTTTTTLPAALLVVLWWRHGGLSWKKDAAPLLPWFLLAVAAGLATAWFETNLLGAGGSGYTLTFVERTLLAGRAVWFYLRILFWPEGQAFFQELWDVPRQAPGWVGYLVASLAVSAVFWLIRRKTRGPLATWLFFGGSLFPALGFFNVFFFAFSYVADHFQYLPAIGIFGGTTAGAAILLQKVPRRWQPAGPVLAGMVILLLTGLTRAQSRHYQNNETLFRASIAQVPDNWMAHRVLAWTLSKDPERDTEAIQHYEISLQLNPRSPDSMNGLAFLLARSSDRQAESIALYQQAIALRPHFAEAHYGLAVELQKDPNHLPEAISHFEAALEEKPGFSGAHLELAQALSRFPDRLPEAFFHFEEALRISPDSAEAHFGLANFLVRFPDRRPEAITQYETALRIDPEAAVVHYNLGNALALTQGRMPEAITHFEEALRIRPDYAEAHANLAEALATLPGRLPEALARYEEALRINPDLAWVHFSLAMRLAALPGRQDDAIRHAETGLRLEPGNLEARNGLAILYVQAGRLRDARAQWEKAIELKPDYEAARENLRRLDQMTRPDQPERR